MDHKEFFSNLDQNSILFVMVQMFDFHCKYTNVVPEHLHNLLTNFAMIQDMPHDVPLM